MVNRNSAVIYEGFYDALQELTPEEQAEAYNAYCRLAFYGESYSGDNKVIRIILKAFEKKVIEAAEKYQNKVEKRAYAGHLGGLKKAENTRKKQDKAAEKDKEDIKDDKKTNEENKGTKRNSEKSEKDSEKNKKQVKHKYGEYGHVMLSDEQYSKLVSEFGESDTKACIQEVDDYCQQSGRTYKDYALAMRKWGFRAVEEHRARTAGRKPNGFDFNESNVYDDDAVAKMMLNRKF